MIHTCLSEVWRKKKEKEWIIWYQNVYMVKSMNTNGKS